ncbi:MAG: hypothetical protein ACFFC9_14440 [Promethearchaeota archaeon]
MYNKELFVSENKRRKNRGKKILEIGKDEKLNSSIKNISKELFNVNNLWLKKKKFEKYLLHHKVE